MKELKINVEFKVLSKENYDEWDFEQKAISHIHMMLKRLTIDNFDRDKDLCISSYIVNTNPTIPKDSIPDDVISNIINLGDLKISKLKFKNSSGLEIEVEYYKDQSNNL